MQASATQCFQVHIKHHADIHDPMHRQSSIRSSDTVANCLDPNHELNPARPHDEPPDDPNELLHGPNLDVAVDPGLALPNVRCLMDCRDNLSFTYPPCASDDYPSISPGPGVLAPLFDQAADTNPLEPQPTLSLSDNSPGGKCTIKYRKHPRSFIAWKSIRDNCHAQQSGRLVEPAGSLGRSYLAGVRPPTGYCKWALLPTPRPKFKSSKLAASLETKLKDMNVDVWQMLHRWINLQKGNTSLNSSLLLHDDDTLDCKGSRTQVYHCLYSLPFAKASA
ncbi:hypothetical protein AAC387_Pa02g5078 [Persea americana]